MEQFLEIVKANGQNGLIVGFFVLLLVFGYNRVGLVATKGQKQAANLVFSLLLSSLPLLEPSSNELVVATLASLGSALAYELIRKGHKWFVDNVGKPAG